MADPSTGHNPELHTKNLADKDIVQQEDQQGHDAPGLQTHLPPDADVEKTGQSQVSSTHSDGSTLENIPVEATMQDSDLVDWDGPDDPQNPMNWPQAKKWTLVACLSGVTLVTPLGSSFFAPGVPEVLDTFHI